MIEGEATAGEDNERENIELDNPMMREVLVSRHRSTKSPQPKSNMSGAEFHFRVSKEMAVENF